MSFKFYYNAPDQAQDDNAQADDRAQNDAAQDGASESDAQRVPPADVPGADAADAANGSQGPPVDLPEQVPDFVGDVHKTIGDHVSGAVDGTQSLGEKLSALTTDDAADKNANETASDASDATATPA